MMVENDVKGAVNISISHATIMVTILIDKLYLFLPEGLTHKIYWLLSLCNWPLYPTLMLMLLDNATIGG